MASLTLQQIRATALGKTPTIEELIAWLDHTIQLESDVGALQGGGTPGWGSSIDTRWDHSETSTSATTYTATVPDASGESLYDGFQLRLRDINQPNSGSATLNIGTVETNTIIKKVDAGGNLINIDAGDLHPNIPAWLYFLGSSYILMNPVTHNSRHHVSTIAPTSGDGNDGDFWYVKA